MSKQGNNWLSKAITGYQNERTLENKPESTYLTVSFFL